MVDVKALAEIVDEAARRGVAVAQLTDMYPALSIETAYAVQAEAIGRRLQRGERRIGVKMGLTSRAKMQQVGVDEVIWGVLTDAMILDDGESLDLDGMIHPRVEPEIAFLLKKPFTGEASAQWAADAVEAVAPALEIIDSRYQDFKFRVADVVADNSSAAGVVIGPWRKPDLDIANLGMILSFDGRPVQVGSSAAILGHPLRALLAAARLTERYGEGLKAGDIVLAGASTAAEPLRPGVNVQLQVQNLGLMGFNTKERK
ncbi:MAG: fumarylacetoacetate hydrolase family protein [Pseudomonadota bacterium]|uniref:2-keto-4-pentenoate hydratase n=1 Tax=unclassified Phenylobacterium TaxID=2640670 RepID=UPI00070165F4|nr:MULTISPECIES: fumarylacetoacetate hydrolase family protein [unclassified Phenylobacterium]KRB48857.1 4-oxalocrotonate decarboxylase [Phenylobacterium sp. Root700]MBT9470505.1 fumarylacetoacetate hydrolase family protein [Phenylobacterium sp.]